MTMSEKVPPPTKNGDSYTYKVAEWRGYVVRALEDMDKEIKDIKKAINDLDDKQDKNVDKVYNRINKLDNSITNLKVKLGTMSAGIAVILSIAISYISSLI